MRRAVLMLLAVLCGCGGPLKAVEPAVAGAGLTVRFRSSQYTGSFPNGFIELCLSVRNDTDKPAQFDRLRATLSTEGGKITPYVGDVQTVDPHHTHNACVLYPRNRLPKRERVDLQIADSLLLDGQAVAIKPMPFELSN